MRRHKGIIKILILCLFIVLVIVYFENFKLEKLIIEGSEHYTSEEIESILKQSKIDDYTHLFYIKYVWFDKLEPIPFVEKLDFEIVDRHTIHIQVYDKMIVGCVEHMGMYMHFDREGIVVECAEEPDQGIPVITGLKFSKVVIGQKMEVEDPSVFPLIRELTQSLQKNGLVCDRIHFDIRQYIKLYIEGSEALLGGGEIHDYQINALKEALAAADTTYRYDLRKYKIESGEIPSQKIVNGQIENNIEELEEKVEEN